MRIFFRCLKADFYKMKRLPIGLAHLLAAAGISVIFLIYFNYSAWNEETQISAYYQVLGMGLPLLIGLFCAMSAEQELSAGSFWNMLSAPKRPVVFFSRLFVLLFLGMATLLLASVLFGTGYFFGMGRRLVAYSTYWEAAFVLMGGSIFLYIQHLFLAFRFNKGVTIALGFVESLLSALFLTGMGDGIWMYTPAAWASRFATLFLMAQSRYDTVNGAFFQDLRMDVYPCVLMTFAALSAYGIWACLWDGQRGDE